MNKNIVLIIGFTWPEPKSTAAGCRMLQLIETFKKKKYRIVFVSASKTTANTFNLEQLGIECKSIVLNNSSFDDFVLELNPNSVVFDRFMTEEQFGWRVAKQCPNALRILDTEDLHCLRKGREEAVKKQELFSNAFLFNDTAKREIASILRCDLSLIISEVEMELLESTFTINKALLYYLPFIVNILENKNIEDLPSFNKRNHFITIGNFLHAPNYDAVLQLKNKIWSKVRQQLPKAELHIYGAYKSEKVTQLHNEKEGFLIKGYAECVNDVMKKAKVCLVPLRFGAGLKGKLVDAMQNGTPSVITTIAAEGMFNTKNNEFITDDFDDFASKAVKLYTNALLWEEMQEKGFKVINSRFDKNRFQEPFLNRIEQVTVNLKQHRQENFIGQLLQHHTLQSTKFMSKWIEEKNKSK